MSLINSYKETFWGDAKLEFLGIKCAQIPSKLHVVQKNNKKMLKTFFSWWKPLFVLYSKVLQSDSDVSWYPLHQGSNTLRILTSSHFFRYSLTALWRRKKGAIHFRQLRKVAYLLSIRKSLFLQTSLFPKTFFLNTLKLTPVQNVIVFNPSSRKTTCFRFKVCDWLTMVLL